MRNPARVLDVTSQVRTEKLIFKDHASKDQRCVQTGRHQRPPRTKRHYSQRRKHDHAEIPGMPDDGVRSPIDDLMSAFSLNPNHRREEPIRHHRVHDEPEPEERSARRERPQEWWNITAPVQPATVDRCEHERQQREGAQPCERRGVGAS